MTKAEKTEALSFSAAHSLLSLREWLEKNHGDDCYAAAFADLKLIKSVVDGLIAKAMG